MFKIDLEYKQFDFRYDAEIEGYANFIYIDKFGLYAKYCGYAKVK